jgi:hypothetical protein
MEQKKQNSEVVAKALGEKVVQELGRLLVQKNRDSRTLRRLLQRAGVDRSKLNVREVLS